MTPRGKSAEVLKTVMTTSMTYAQVVKGLDTKVPEISLEAAKKGAYQEEHKRTSKSRGGPNIAWHEHRHLTIGNYAEEGDRRDA